jgi:hypothetical protein
VSREGIAKLTDFGNTALKEARSLCFTATTGTFNFSLRWTVGGLQLLIISQMIVDNR